VPSAKALWLKPEAGFTGNHIVVADSNWVFDYHGYSNRDRFLVHTRRKAERWWPGWKATLVPLPRDVLISEVKSRAYEGLWLREPTQFLHDALPRARAYLVRFPAPDLWVAQGTVVRARKPCFLLSRLYLRATATLLSMGNASP
jgi:hypothetical protein